MHIFIDKFGGIVPRQLDHSLDITQATKAHNVRLRRNRIEAWREPLLLFDQHAKGCMLHMRGCCPLLFATPHVSVAEVAPDWDRYFLTGNADYPQIAELQDGCRQKFSRLGLPQPAAPLHISGKTICARSSDARAYVYTYVNIWGEESAPSMVSNVITVDDEEAVTLSGFALPDDDYNIESINVYRAVTGMREQTVQHQEFNTNFLWVATIPAGRREYTDRLPMTEVGPVLETEKVRMPPKDLQNIVSFDATVQLAGSVCNRICFTEPFQTYNWPIKYELTLDNPVVHMGVCYGKLFVTTDSYPYIISAPDCEGQQCTSVQKLATPLPDIGCYYAHSAVTSPYGYIFASPVGLTLLKPDGSYDILTAQWFSPEDWMQIVPQTIRIGIWQNYIFFITERASFVLNIDRVSYGDMQGCELSTISDKPTDLVTSGTGDLLMLMDGKIWAWDKGTQYRPYFWESRELVGQDGIKSAIQLGVARQNDARGVSWSPASAKVHTERTQFTLISPLQNPAYSRSVTGEDWFRIPHVGRNLWYKLRFEGIRPVDFVAMGTSNFTLNQGK